MDRGAWPTTAHGVTESDRTEQQQDNARLQGLWLCQEKTACAAEPDQLANSISFLSSTTVINLF